MTVVLTLEIGYSIEGIERQKGRLKREEREGSIVRYIISSLVI